MRIFFYQQFFYKVAVFIQSRCFEFQQILTLLQRSGCQIFELWKYPHSNFGISLLFIYFSLRFAQIGFIKKTLDNQNLFVKQFLNCFYLCFLILGLQQVLDQIRGMIKEKTNRGADKKLRNAYLQENPSSQQLNYHANNEEDHSYYREKRQSSMLDLSNENGVRFNERKHEITKRREAKQQRIEVCAIFKELMSIINGRYISAQNLDVKSSSMEFEEPALHKKASSFISKKNKEDGEKIIKNKLKDKVANIMSMDKKEALRQQKEQIKQEVLNNYQCLMSYSINQQSEMEIEPIIHEEVPNQQNKTIKNFIQVKPPKSETKRQLNKKNLSFFSFGVITILPQLSQKSECNQADKAIQKFGEFEQEFNEEKIE